MRFDDSRRIADTAKMNLERVRTNTDGWSDELRQRFDAQRFRPLTEAGIKLVEALKRAQEQTAAAERLRAD